MLFAEHSRVVMTSSQGSEMELKEAVWAMFSDVIPASCAVFLKWIDGGMLKDCRG